jgi:DNA-binding NtrC family response regulator
LTAPGSPPTVLVVDDEENVRTALDRVLGDEGYEVLVAENGQEALEILRSRPVHLLISDNNMPGMSGLELFKEAIRLRPQMLRIMLTGDTDPELAVRSINEAEVYRFIRKPWSNAELRTIVHLAFEVILLEAEKRQLLEIVRRYRAARERGEAPPSLESELLLLAEADLIETT